MYVLAAQLLTGSVTAQGDMPAYVSPRDPADEYLDAIDRIEADYGPYASELSDLYIGLAQVRLNDGEFEKARDAYHRAVLGIRVNAGPNSPEQTNHLFLLANTEILLGNLKAAEDVLQNIKFINTEHYGEDNAELLPVLDRIYEWRLLTQPPGSLATDYDDYNRMIKLAEQMKRISEGANGPAHPDTAAAYRRLATAEFQMVRHLTGLGQLLEPEQYVLITAGSLVPLGLGAEPVADHFGRGRRAYRQYIEALAGDESTTPLEFAEALAELADWYMVFDKPRKSRLLYNQAYELLAESPGHAQLAEQWMDQPRPMHFVREVRVTSENVPETIGAPTSSIEISMTVTRLGKVRRVEVVQPPEGLTDDDLSQIRDHVRGLPFRPAMKDGEIVTTDEFIWRLDIAPPRATS